MALKLTRIYVKISVHQQKNRICYSQVIIYTNILYMDLKIFYA